MENERNLHKQVMAEIRSIIDNGVNTPRKFITRDAIEDEMASRHPQKTYSEVHDLALRRYVRESSRRCHSRIGDAVEENRQIPFPDFPLIDYIYPFSRGGKPALVAIGGIYVGEWIRRAEEHKNQAEGNTKVAAEMIKFYVANSGLFLEGDGEPDVNDDSMAA